MIPHARVLIEKRESILLIHRINQGREYYILPGGHVEKNESFISCAIREAKEETNLDVELLELLWVFSNSHQNEKKIVCIYRVNNFSGDIKLNGPEKDSESENNKYIHEWINTRNLKNLNIQPEIQKNKLLKYYYQKED